MRTKDLNLVSDYIDRSSSNIIKGILICLIIIGHNYILTDALPGLFNDLYSFHVFIFFILPCFYQQTSITYLKTFKRSFKLLVYYLIFFIVLVTAYHYMYEVDFSFSNTLASFLKGGHMSLDAVTGYQYLWFLPAFLITMLIYDLYHIISNRWKIVFCILSFIVYLYFVRYPYTQYCAIIQGVYFASVGLLAVVLYNLVKKVITIRVLLPIFMALSVALFIPCICKVIVPIMPFVSFAFLWEVARTYKDKLSCFEKLGKNSLLIYLIHPIVYQLLIRLLPIKTMLIQGLIVLFLTIIVSALISSVVNRVLESFTLGGIKSIFIKNTNEAR